LAGIALRNGRRHLEIGMLKTVPIALCLVATMAMGGCATRRGNAMLTDGAIGAGGGALLLDGSKCWEKRLLTGFATAKPIARDNLRESK